ncbi:enoyl-CoA hydratase/isomerase family protein [Rhodococcus sp. BP-349]|jgi:enoyl-CoA hydratase/carnithine racemase|uniref:enoyl-CoA hydratase/isomerase family protein n=1 Tax=unclassified Rhodococcus (in: high G+C Gram-positive bacteria) TaxID=192944 RepID=UPI001C9A3BED|nr:MULTISPECIES: enoyl-CoA hydratase/isomerase family protein [unclassified Rhodococcus (in: high G+C Gram-positive bacteria)]MBY6538850.1 enoyl-CoA hydratase/isomerase family protein [Rhodococcus sp. BP-363]MBY6543187.1 enoyl-CoA hydratase/isomerase family protein [Rhodococcus sp. BP-369]MBY6562417.1 enoyl-CoA hydratase/isomerase family protein [Rhodococcus sp. BP-370]MBY6576709.1 enoyl-CoA hydratase/isomerase family protein [Rhodococcus sp. BP-364]MBY6586010.1 enoyl-CoA hydratase/isomerase f
MPSLDRHGDVFVLSLAHADGVNPENRFHPEWIEQVHTLLDEAEASEGPAALVTVGGGKFYSNGLDTDYLFSHADSIPEYLDLVHTVYTRLLRFPMATVAAVQGHAFGAGAMLALCHDTSVMRADRGFFCLPEVNLGMPFTEGMSTLLAERLPSRTMIDAMTTGRRYGGADALEFGIVQAVAGEDELLSTAVAQAAERVSTRGANLTSIKDSIHVRTLAALSVPTAESTFSLGQ